MKPSSMQFMRVDRHRALASREIVGSKRTLEQAGAGWASASTSTASGASQAPEASASGTGPGEDLTWCDVSGGRHAFELKDSLEVLGCVLSTDITSMVKHRLSKAEAAFWAHKAFYCNPRVAWQLKLREYLKRIRPIALYGSVLWTWDAGVHALLRGWEIDFCE